MSSIILLIVVILPVVCGALIPVLPFRNRKQMLFYIEAVVVLNSILAFSMILDRPNENFVMFELMKNLSISFKLDGLGSVFVALISALWPLATLYSFEYMKHEGHEKVFFMFYTITFGVTMGIALAEDIITMYCFYEMLTLVTVPLVLHTLTRQAVLASRTYLYYSLGGAAFAFIGVIFILIYGNTVNFTPGGVLNVSASASNANLLLFVYVLCFFGFSVKAAMFPFSGWLPKAGVAPTPVTALLHAVAVVKAGAFAIMRITYFCFGCEFLRGTWAQSAVLVPVVFTIVYGCSRALKETHLKRRLAWSTVSNLSYVLFGAALMSPLGLLGALCHMIFHAVMKITSFFTAGAVICQAKTEYIFQMDGLGKKMPKTFAVFTLSGLALMGVPGLCGFSSKWNLVKAALEGDHLLAIIGVAAIMVSALLTAIYMLSVSVRAFFPAKNSEDADAGKDRVCDNIDSRDKNITDPNWMMMLPLAVFSAAIIFFGLHPQPVIDILAKVVSLSY